MESKVFFSWLVFCAIVFVMLLLDLGVSHRKVREVKIKEALLWSFIWIALALLFNLGIYFVHGPQKALSFLTSYLIEKSLSLDNIFVFLLIFSYFRIPRLYQHTVLFWGILGALIIRAVFIILGLKLISRFEWVFYLFGILLIVTGIKLAFEKDKEIQPERNLILSLFKKIVPFTQDYDDGKFFILKNGQQFATPLLISLLVVETTDLIFAVDSIPAVLAITVDPFIVYTSNIFAILGLRSLYFALAGMLELFHYLHYGLSFILVFVGIKMMTKDIFHIPTIVTLGVISVVLAISIGASIGRLRNIKAKTPLAR